MNRSQWLKPAIALVAVLGFGVWFLALVFRGSLILNPVAFRMGPLAIHWYGLIMAVAITAAFALAVRRMVKRGVSDDHAELITFWAVISGLLGARLGFVVQNLGYFSTHAFDILAVNHGGLSIHGAVLLGAFAAVVAARRYHVSFLTLLDAMAPALLLGAIIGRLGNFFNYELYGYPTNVAWKMFVPPAYRLPGYATASFFHPTFLYEALMNLVVLALFCWYERRAKPRVGTMALLVLAGYSVSRLIVEFFRIGSPIDGLTLAQWVSVAVILSATLSIYLRSRTVRVAQ